MSTLTTPSEYASFGGTVSFHEHRSETCDATMRFAVYQPPQAKDGPVGVLGRDADRDLGSGAGFYVDATAESWSRHYRTYSYVTRELPDLYRSVSAFGPICAPVRVPWGQRAFSVYFGPDEEAWREHDASELARERPFPDDWPILVDQGDADQFLDEQLSPGVFGEGRAESGQPLFLRWREGYDYGYFFISTFMQDHIEHHAVALNRRSG